jgi:integrase
VQAENRAIYPVIVLMCSGLRTVGCTRLQWKDLELNGQKPLVRVPLEKGLKRTVPLSQWAAEKLAAWKLKHPPKSDHFRVYPGDSNNAGRDLRTLRGTNNKLTFGAMRRMASTRLYQAGVTPQLAAKIMGHSVRVALQHYVQMEAMNAHAAVQALDYATQPPQNQRPFASRSR